MSIHPAFKAKGISREVAAAALYNRVVELEHQVHALTARLAEVDSLRTLVNALIQKDDNTGKYVEFLREKYGIGK
jgi:hypothetical protein